MPGGLSLRPGPARCPTRMPDVCTPCAPNKGLTLGGATEVGDLQARGVEV